MPGVSLLDAEEFFTLEEGPAAKELEPPPKPEPERTFSLDDPPWGYPSSEITSHTIRLHNGGHDSSLYMDCIS